MIKKINAPAKFVFAVIVYALLAACNVSALEVTTEEKNIRFENNYGGYAEGGNFGRDSCGGFYSYALLYNNPCRNRQASPLLIKFTATRLKD